MSRIGKLPITVPSGVEVTIDGRDVRVKGPKGTLSRTISAPSLLRRTMKASWWSLVPTMSATRARCTD